MDPSVIQIRKLTEIGDIKALSHNDARYFWQTFFGKIFFSSSD